MCMLQMIGQGPGNSINIPPPQAKKYDDRQLYTKNQLRGIITGWGMGKGGGVTNGRRVQSTGEHGVIEEPVH
jgi:hypothetical protein